MRRLFSRAKKNSRLLTEEQVCFRQLQSLGIDPDNIEYVLLSHLHWDHTGAVGRFPNRVLWFAVCGLLFVLVVVLVLEGLFSKPF